MLYEHSHVVEKTTCKVCHHMLDGALAEGQAKPKEGDFSVCAYCATIGRYTEDGQIQPMSEGALEIMEEHNPRQYKELKGVAKMIKQIINDKS